MKRKTKLGPLDSQGSATPALSSELQGWIDRVIVPILVKEFIRTRGLQKEANNG